MLLTLTTTRPPATDLGWLLHKNPQNVQAFELTFGQAHVFYPEASEERCTAAMVLDVDPIGLVRRKGKRGGDAFSLHHYVNDRPYVASSFMSVAIAQVYGSALAGRCRDRPALADESLPLEARVAVLPCRGGEPLLRELFEPLGYEVEATRHPLDEKFPEWGESGYFTVALRGARRVRDLLRHLYVLIPVLDNEKHYWVGDDEVEKLLGNGEGWLADHPRRDEITRRYLKYQRGLARAALARLAEEDHPDPDAEALDHGREEAALEAQVEVDAESLAATLAASSARLASSSASAPRSAGSVNNEEPTDARATRAADDSSAADADAVTQPSAPGDDVSDDEPPERGPTLNSQRHATVLAVLRGCGAKSVIDVGCGEGKLLRLLLSDVRFERIVGMDVSIRSLRIASERLRLDRLPPMKRRRIELMQGSLTYRDARLAGFDAATCVEVIEHLDPPRLSAFERVLFEFARPATVVITTPNREYNVMWETLPAGKLRHRDHRFEWTRAEFEAWTAAVAARFGYTARHLPIGPEDRTVGAPTQMGVLQRE